MPEGVVCLAQAYLDGELCGVAPDGVTRFSIVQLASDAGNAAALVFFLFDLLHLDREDLTPKPILERKERLAALLPASGSPLHYSDHHIGRGPAFYEHPCKMSVEGIVSERIDAVYAPGNRGLWRKVKCLNRDEFVVVGWTDPEGRRPHLGALLLAYHDSDGRLIYAGRVGAGMNNAELHRLWRRLQPDAARCAAAALDPFWIASRLEPRALGTAKARCRGEISHLDRGQSAPPGRLSGLREDNPAIEVRPPVPRPQPDQASRRRR